ncbi:unnamed protein product, partial [marine sediment metagenome]
SIDFLFSLIRSFSLCLVSGLCLYALFVGE